MSTSPVALVAQQAFDAVPADRRPTADDIDALSHALVMLLICAAPDPAALEGDGKATIQAIRTFAHHAISVFFERFRTLVGNTNGKADEEDIDRAWQYMDRFIFYLRTRQYQDDEFLPELVDGLAALIEQDEKGVERLRSNGCFNWNNRDWFKDRVQEVKERREVCHAMCMSMDADYNTSQTMHADHAHTNPSELSASLVVSFPAATAKSEEHREVCCFSYYISHNLQLIRMR